MYGTVRCPSGFRLADVLQTRISSRGSGVFNNYHETVYMNNAVYETLRTSRYTADVWTFCGNDVCTHFAEVRNKNKIGGAMRHPIPFVVSGVSHG